MAKNTRANKLEQHFIKASVISDMSGRLRSLDLNQRQVLEFGLGTGELTRGILQCNPRRVIGFEVDKDLPPRDISDRIELVVEDFTKVDFSFLKDELFCIVSFPPYKRLPFIRSLIEDYRIKDVFLMIPEKERKKFTDYREVCSLNGSFCFTPPSKGEHFIIKKGFS